MIITAASVKRNVEQLATKLVVTWNERVEFVRAMVSMFTTKTTTRRMGALRIFR
jgi:hypothetical protein